MKRDCNCPRARHEHGTRAAYLRDSCRCHPCRQANHYALASYKAGETWRERDDLYVPKQPTARRLQSLMRIGYSARDIGARTGMSTEHVQNLRNGANPAVTAHIEARVRAAFRDLWDKPPTGPRAQAQRTKAAKLGYPLPIEVDDDNTDPILPDDKIRARTSQPPCTADSIDEIAVTEAIGGRRVPLTRAEKTEAVRRMTEAGYSASQIARRLSTSDRTITRRRSAA